MSQTIHVTKGLAEQRRALLRGRWVAAPPRDVGEACLVAHRSGEFSSGLLDNTDARYILRVLARRDFAGVKAAIRQAREGGHFIPGPYNRICPTRPVGIWNDSQPAYPDAVGILDEAIILAKEATVD